MCVGVCALIADISFSIQVWNLMADAVPVPQWVYHWGKCVFSPPFGQNSISQTCGVKFYSKVQCSSLVLVFDNQRSVPKQWPVKADAHWLPLQFLPVYTPSEEEKRNPALFAINVRRVMAKYVDRRRRHDTRNCTSLMHAWVLGMPRF